MIFGGWDLRSSLALNEKIRLEFRDRLVSSKKRGKNSPDYEETQHKYDIYTSGRVSLPASKTASTLILNLKSLKTMQTKYLLCKPPSHCYFYFSVN